MGDLSYKTCFVFVFVLFGFFFFFAQLLNLKVVNVNGRK